MTAPNPYEVLGVDPSASALEVQAAYERLRARVHPDAGGTAGLLRVVEAAWASLRDGDAASAPADPWAPHPYAASGALPQDWATLLGLLRQGRVDALSAWEAVDAIAAGDPQPLKGLRPRAASDVSSAEELMLLTSQADQLFSLLSQFAERRLSPDELSGEALELLGLSEETDGDA